MSDQENYSEENRNQQQEYNRQDYNQQGYNQQQNYSQQDWNQQGYNQQQDWNQQSYNQQQDWNQQGYNQQQDYYQQGYSQQQGYYSAQQPYGNYQPPKNKKDGIGFGIASMVLGILSLLLFCTCINYLLAILAIIFGIVQLMRNKQKGMAVTGLITSVLAVILSTVFWIYCIRWYQDDNFWDMYYDIYDDMYDDLYDDYYYDYDYYDYDYDDALDYGDDSISYYIESAAGSCEWLTE